MTPLAAVPSTARQVAETYVHASTAWTLVHLAVGLATIAATVWASVLASENRGAGGFGALACAPAVVAIFVLAKLARHTSGWSVIGLLVLGVLVAAGVALRAGYDSQGTDQVFWYVAASIWGFALMSMLIEEALTRFAASIPMAVGDLVRVLLFMGICALVWLSTRGAPARSQRRSW